MQGNLPINSLLKKIQCNNKNIQECFKKSIETLKDDFWNFDILNQKIYSLQHFKNKVSPFIVSKKWKREDEVEIDKIVGTDHLKYIGMTYLGMLEKGIKMDINIPLLLKNPQYYYDKEPKSPTIFYSEFNTQDNKKIAFVDGDGNHRTALAKVIRAFDKSYTKISGITKTEYVIDYNLMEKFYLIKKELEKYNYQVIISSKERDLIENKEENWLMWLYSYNIEIIGKNGIQVYDDINKIDIIKYLPFFKKIKYFLGLSA